MYKNIVKRYEKLVMQISEIFKLLTEIVKLCKAKLEMIIKRQDTLIYIFTIENLTD